MSQNETKSDAGHADTAALKEGGRGTKANVVNPGADVGSLLRSAYRQTIDEAIPDDLMDLLDKLE